MAMDIRPIFIFDLDGTLVDSVYEHVLAWQEALDAEGIPLSVWRIHRKIGMSGGLFTNQLLRETHMEITEDRVERLRYQRLSGKIRPLPGARELLQTLTDSGIPWAIATSGRMETAAPNLAALGVDVRQAAVVTGRRRQVCKTRPRSLSGRRGQVECAHHDGRRSRGQHLGHARRRRCQALGVGLLSGGYGLDELERAGAYRVYEDPADMLEHLDEVGGRR
jgi:phosphoglycolate phosphatase-like HAD superfamily hydrolase